MYQFFLWKISQFFLNFDEAHFPFDGSTGRATRVLVPRGSKVVNRRATGTKEGITVGLTISADGTLFPPQIVTAGKADVPGQGTIQMEAFEEAAYIQSSEG